MGQDILFLDVLHEKKPFKTIKIKPLKTSKNTIF